MGLKHITPSKVLECIADDLAYDLHVTKTAARDMLADVLASDEIWNIIIDRVRSRLTKK